MSNTGNELWTVVSEPGWRGAVREGMDSAGKVRPVCAQQPATFSLLSFGHLFWETMRSFIICKNEGGETSLSCSESCTGWDHLSDVIESLGCSAGGSVQPWTNTYTYICEFKTLFVCSV